MTRPRQSILLPRIARSCALLALAPLLAGCVAAIVAVPAMTAAGVLSERKNGAGEAADAATIEAPATGAPAAPVQLTRLTELPAPTADRAIPDPVEQWRAFAGFAREGAAALASGVEVESALLAPDSPAGLQARKRPCVDREPAVIVDIDPREAVFAPGAGAQALSGVAAMLAELREAGVVVLWLSRLHANEIDRVADALRTSGLDPAGRDPILLVRNAEERKQVLREQAAQTVCVIAIAGDERADFDELFDYLRDPTMAGMYDTLLGAGWFLVPPPFADPVAVEVPDLSAAAPAGEDSGR